MRTDLLGAPDCPHVARHGEHQTYQGADRLLYCYHCQLQVPDAGDRGHPHTLVEFHGKTIEIDDELVPIIRALWERGIHTTACCQGDPPGRGDDDPWSDYGYIAFNSNHDAERFMNLVAGPLGISRIHSDDGLALLRAKGWPEEVEFIEPIDPKDAEVLPPFVLEASLYQHARGHFQTTLIIRFPNQLIPKLVTAAESGAIST